MERSDWTDLVNRVVKSDEQDNLLCPTGCEGTVKVSWRTEVEDVSGFYTLTCQKCNEHVEVWARMHREGAASRERKVEKSHARSPLTVFLDNWDSKSGEEWTQLDEQLLRLLLSLSGDQGLVTEEHAGMLTGWASRAQRRALTSGDLSVLVLALVALFIAEETYVDRRDLLVVVGNLKATAVAIGHTVDEVEARLRASAVVGDGEHELLSWFLWVPLGELGAAAQAILKGV